MLKKNERTDIKEISLNKDILHEIDDNTLVTPSLAIMVNNYLDSKSMDDHNEFEKNKIDYINDKNENKIKKRYNSLIVDLYKKGSIIINSNQYELKHLYILFTDGKDNYHLTDSKSIYTDVILQSEEKIEYNNAIKFIDSTAFITLINDPLVDIIDNIIMIKDNNVLLNNINNWDGLIHNKIWFTDSIKKKKVLRVEDYE